MQPNYRKEGPAVMPLLLKNADRNNVAWSNQSLFFVCCFWAHIHREHEECLCLQYYLMQHRHIHFCLRTESIKMSGYYGGDEQGDSEEQRMDRVQIQVMTLVFHHLRRKRRVRVQAAGSWAACLRAHTTF